MVSGAVVVVGVARYLGARLAKALAEHPKIDRVVGVDSIEPGDDIGDAEFVEADIRTSSIARAIKRARAETVVHMNVLATHADAGGRAPQKEINVIGTMQLLAACQRSDTVAKLIVKSSAAVYGANANAPALFAEDMVPAGARRGYEKDASEVEAYVRGFTRRRPDIDVTILRMANVIGPGVRTPLTDFFALPIAPVVVGRDPRFQLLHEDDCVGALSLCVLEDRPGIYNVAGDGFIVLSQAVARAGRPLLPVPALGNSIVNGLLNRAGVTALDATQAAFLTYGRGLDTTRMREQLHFSPSFTTSEAFDSYLEGVSAGVFAPERVTKLTDAMRKVVSAVSPPGAGRGRNPGAGGGNNNG